MKKEIWKPVKGYEKEYEVSNLGRVRSLDRKRSFFCRGIWYTTPFKGMMLKPSMIKKGYVRVRLRYQYIMIHRLVATAFIKNKNPLRDQINHKNFIKTDNRVENLEWVTQSENMKHSISAGRRPNLKLVPKDIIEIRKLVKANVGRKEICRRFGVCSGTIKTIISGKRWAWVK